MAIGDLGSIIETNALWAAGGTSEYPSMIRLYGKDNVYAVASRVDGTGLTISTFSVDSDGAITLLDAYSVGGYAVQGRVWICHANEDIYAVACDGGGNDGYLLTYEILSTTGAITYKDVYEFNEAFATDVCLSAITNGKVALAFKGNFVDDGWKVYGWIYSFSISTVGTITEAPIADLHIDSLLNNQITIPFWAHVIDDEYMLFYLDASRSLGRVQSRTVTSIGTCSAANSVLSLTTNNCPDSYIKVSDRIIAVVYTVSSKPRVVTFRLNQDKTITQVASLDSTRTSTYNRICGYPGLAFVTGRSATNTLVITSFSISSDGVTITQLDDNTYATISIPTSNSAPALGQGGDHAIVVSAGSDTPINTITIETGRVFYPSDAVTRVSGIVRRYSKGDRSYSCEVTLGGVTTDFALPAMGGVIDAIPDEPLPEFTRNYPCAFCNQSFTTRDALIAHMKIDHKVGIT